jgi:hypothetical protein
MRPTDRTKSPNPHGRGWRSIDRDRTRSQSEALPQQAVQLSALPKTEVAPIRKSVPTRLIGDDQATISRLIGRPGVSASTRHRANSCSSVIGSGSSFFKGGRAAACRRPASSRSSVRSLRPPRSPGQTPRANGSGSSTCFIGGISFGRKKRRCCQMLIAGPIASSTWSAPRSPTHPLLRGGPRSAPLE